MKPVSNSQLADSLAGGQPVGETVELSELSAARNWPEDPVTKDSGRSAAGILSPASREITSHTPVDPAIEPLRQLLLREAARFRQHAPGSMALVVCMDERTELLVHFAQSEHGIDASARCEPADLPRLAALWPQLQQTLAPRRIQLAPLRGAPDRSSTRTVHPVPARIHENQSRTNVPAAGSDWETWA